MEPNELLSDELLNSVPLEHHGIKGMKWGVWNSETRAKYMGGKGRAISKNVKKAGAKAVDKVQKVASAKVSQLRSASAAKKAEKQKAKAAKKAEKEEIAEQRKELGMTRAKYNDLRKTTLSSHDPSVVAKGMSVLTDAELDAKLDRLRKEDQIARLATDQKTRKHQEHKARSEAIKANPLYGIGVNVAGRAIKKATKGLVDINKEDKKNKDKNKGDNGNSKNNNNNAQTASAKNNSVPEAPKVRNDSWKSASSPYSMKGSGSYERVQKVVRDSSIYNEPYNAAKSAASRGERLLTDDKVRATIIDVQPISATSERAEARKYKALPAAS